MRDLIRWASCRALVVAVSIGLVACDQADEGVSYEPLVPTGKADGVWDGSPVAFDAACDEGPRVVLAFAGQLAADTDVDAVATVFDEADVGMVAAGSDVTATNALGASVAASNGNARLMEIEGIGVAWLACGTDAHELRCTEDEAAIVRAIEELGGKAEVDVVIVSADWGVRGIATPTDAQVVAGRAFADAGASVVLGTGSEVVQPIEQLATADGRQALISYGMGDVGRLSHLSRRAFAVGLVGLTRTEDGLVAVNGVRYVPFTAQRGALGGATCVFAEDASSAAAKNVTVGVLGAWNQHRRDQVFETTPQCADGWTAAHPLDGWVGGGCATDLACGGALCDLGYADGLCTLPCTRYCADRDGRPTTFCVTGADDTGRCMSQCIGDGDCRSGWHCASRQRHGQPSVTRQVCVPDGPATDPDPVDPDPIDPDPVDPDPVDPDPVGTVDRCGASLTPADGSRFVIAHRRLNDPDVLGTTYDVYRVSADGSMSLRSSFEGPGASDGRIVFDPAGRIGVFVRETGDWESGKLTSIVLSADGTARVGESGLEEVRHGEQVVFSADGASLLVLKKGMLAHGGGVYRMAVGCDGSLVNEGLVLGTDRSSTVGLVADDRWLLTGKGLTGAGGSGDVHLVNPHDGAVLDSVTAFGEEAIMGPAAIVPGGRHALVTDTSIFGAEIPLAAISINGDRLASVQEMHGVSAISDIAFSADGKTVLLADAFGDAVHVLGYAASSSTPFTVRQKVPMGLAASVHVFRGGAMSDMVVVVRSLGLHRQKIGTDGRLRDRGLTRTQVGVFGAQP